MRGRDCVAIEWERKTATYERMKISTGIGLRLSPELAVLSLLSLPKPLDCEEPLSVRSCVPAFCAATGVADVLFSLRDDLLVHDLTLAVFLGDCNEARLK